MKIQNIKPMSKILILCFLVNLCVCGNSDDDQPSSSKRLKLGLQFDKSNQPSLQDIYSKLRYQNSISGIYDERLVKKSQYESVKALRKWQPFNKKGVQWVIAFILLAIEYFHSIEHISIIAKLLDDLFLFFSQKLQYYQPLHFLKDLTFLSAFFPLGYGPYIQLVSNLREQIGEQWSKQEQLLYKPTLRYMQQNINAYLKSSIKKMKTDLQKQFLQMLLNVLIRVRKNKMGTFGQRIRCYLHLGYIKFQLILRGWQEVKQRNQYTYGFIQQKGIIRDLQYPFRYSEDGTIGLAKNQFEIFCKQMPIVDTQYKQYEDRQNKRQDYYFKNRNKVGCTSLNQGHLLTIFSQHSKQQQTNLQQKQQQLIQVQNPQMQKQQIQVSTQSHKKSKSPPKTQLQSVDFIQPVSNPQSVYSYSQSKRHKLSRQKQTQNVQQQTIPLTSQLKFAPIQVDKLIHQHYDVSSELVSVGSPLQEDDLSQLINLKQNELFARLINKQGQFQPSQNQTDFDFIQDFNQELFDLPQQSPSSLKQNESISSKPVFDFTDVNFFQNYFMPNDQDENQQTQIQRQHQQKHD